MFHPHGPTFWELARQCLSSTEVGYDLLAPKFDFTPFRTPNDLLQQAASCFGDGGPIDDALDVCCGTGAAMRVLRPLCRRRVVGVDFSQRMMEIARQKTQDAPGNAVLQFVRSNVLNLPFLEQFDLAVTFGSLGHILPKDEPRFVQQVHRALRLGGRFVFATCELPPLWSKTYWLCRGFNGLMHVRNLFWRPPFVMYYLTFLLPQAKQHLVEAGFKVETHPGVFPSPFERLVVVVATKTAS